MKTTDENIIAGKWYIDQDPTEYALKAIYEHFEYEPGEFIKKWIARELKQEDAELICNIHNKPITPPSDEKERAEAVLKPYLLEAKECGDVGEKDAVKAMLSFSAELSADREELIEAIQELIKELDNDHVTDYGSVTESLKQLILKHRKK